ncbi:MAG: hypothetical protein Q9M92_10595 [Enterobacterales bacterium]|nr:hypothetical protein [Enterobacterales bacterium]
MSDSKTQQSAEKSSHLSKKIDILIQPFFVGIGVPLFMGIAPHPQPT